MHACGHDAHMAMALGAAAALRELSGELRGCVKFVFQPAEEGPGGAKPMIEAGVLEHQNVDFCVGCHLWPGVPEGQIGVKAGPIMAAMDRFDLKIAGKGGHGAMPHLCVDALEVGTQVVAALQRVVSRKMNPLSPTVVTVGTFSRRKGVQRHPGRGRSERHDPDLRPLGVAVLARAPRAGDPGGVSIDGCPVRVSLHPGIPADRQ